MGVWSGQVFGSCCTESREARPRLETVICQGHSCLGRKKETPEQRGGVVRGEVRAGEGLSSHRGGCPGKGCPPPTPPRRLSGRQKGESTSERYPVLRAAGCAMPWLLSSLSL